MFFFSYSFRLFHSNWDTNSHPARDYWRCSQTTYNSILAWIFHCHQHYSSPKTVYCTAAMFRWTHTILNHLKNSTDVTPMTRSFRRLSAAPHIPKSPSPTKFHLHQFTLNSLSLIIDPFIMSWGGPQVRYDRRQFCHLIVFVSWNLYQFWVLGMLSHKFWCTICTYFVPTTLTYRHYTKIV